MGEDNEQNDPVFKAMDLEPFKPAKIVLESAKAVASGESKYGNWNLWTINVENQLVSDKVTKKPIPNFTGKAVMFPSEKLHEKFLKHTNGTQEGVTIELQLTPVKNARGSFYTTFETKLIEAGETSPSNLLETQNTFIEDFKNISDSNIVPKTKEAFTNFAKSDTYKIPDESIDKLWAVFKEQHGSE